MTMKRIFCAVLAACLGSSIPAIAQTSGETDALAPIATVSEAESTVFTTVTVEGEDITVEMRQAADDDAEPLIDADPIIKALRGRWETRDALLLVQRYQDGADMLLDMRDGKVRGNGVVLGALPGWEERETADTWLPPNAIAVMTGTGVSVSSEDGRYVFVLDDRLRPQFGLELFVQNQRILADLAPPRTVGSVLIVPLSPIAEALGSEVTLSDDEQDVTVVRSQDSAVITLNLNTGLVTVNGNPRGLTPNIAYAERVEGEVLLPFTAVETLTGTHVKLIPGSARIDVSLDDRLTSAAMPGERVDTVTDNTPFTPERLDFSVSDSGTNQADFHSRWKGFNTKLRYQSSGSISEPAALAPSLLSLDVRSQSGWTATLGDYNAEFGETTGVGASRTRGVAWRTLTKDGGLLAVSAGVPLVGNEQVADDVSRPVYGGFAAGVRKVSDDGRREYSLSALSAEDGDTRAVATYQRSFDLSDNVKGFTNANVSGEAAVFDEALRSGFDVRARGNIQYRFGPRASIRATGSYDGALFFQSAAREPSGSTDPARFEGALSQDAAPRIAGSVSSDWRAERDWGPLRAPSLAGRINFTHQGDSSNAAVSAALSTQVTEIGPQVSLSISRGMADTPTGTTETTSFSVRAFKNFDWGTLTASYNQSDNAEGLQQRFVGTVGVNPWVRRLDKGASVSFGPSASAVWSPESQSVRFGLGAGFNSGSMFGERFTLNSSFSAGQSVNPEESRTDLVASLTGQYRLTRGVVLQLGYVDDLRNRRNLSIGLRGSFQFAEPRKYSRPDDGRGVLKGRVFFDRNRDGVRQDDEPGIGGLMVRVTGTGLALRADRQGYFTIQNMPPGLYSVVLDKRALPLGMLVSEDESGRATLAPDRITTMDIPVIASGQVRGAAFIDADGDGEITRGEERLEGAVIELVPQDDAETVTQRAAAFGQYGFESLNPGTYTITVSVGGRVRHRSTIELSDDNLFRVLNLAVPPMSAETPPKRSGGGVLSTP